MPVSRNLRDIRTYVQTPIKKVAFSAIRGAHKVFSSKPLPDRLGIYFHALEKPDWPAFQSCVEALRSAGYEIVSLDDYVAPLAKGQRKAFLSFDDNYKSWYEALPLFEALDVTVTFYVNTLPFRDTASQHDISDYFDRIDHHSDRTTMTCDELKALHVAGHTIAAHTHSHPVLSALPREKWEEEIVGCKRILEDLLGEDIRHFSYPYGMRRFFSKDLQEYCFENGFETIAAAIPGLQHDTFDPSYLHRTRWGMTQSADYNLEDLCIDGRLFERTTGRSAIG